MIQLLRASTGSVPRRSLIHVISSNPSTCSSSFFSTSALKFDSGKGKGKERSETPSTLSSHTDLSESIKSLMRNSAQSVGVILSYIEHSSSSTSQASSSPSHHQDKSKERSVHGATLSSFTTVSLEPPIVAFSLRTPSRLADALLSPNQKQNISEHSGEAHFIINILSSTQASIASSFAKPSLKRYSQKNWQAPSIGETDSDLKSRLEAGHHPLDLFPHRPSEMAGGVPFLTESMGALACSVLKKFDLDDFDGLNRENPGNEKKKSDGSQLFLARVHAVEGMGNRKDKMEEEKEEEKRLPLVYWKQKFCTVGEQVE